MTVMDAAEVAIREAFKSNVEDLALAEVSRLEAEKETLESALRDVSEGLKAAKGVLRVLHPEAKPAPRPGPKKDYPVFNMTDERLAVVVEFLTGNDSEIVAKDLQHATGWPKSYCQRAVVFLREQNILRLVRVEGRLHTYRSTI